MEIRSWLFNELCIFSHTLIHSSVASPPPLTFFWCAMTRIFLSLSPVLQSAIPRLVYCWLVGRLVVCVMYWCKFGHMHSRTALAMMNDTASVWDKATLLLNVWTSVCLCALLLPNIWHIYHHALLICPALSFFHFCSLSQSSFSTRHMDLSLFFSSSSSSSSTHAFYCQVCTLLLLLAAVNKVPIRREGMGMELCCTATRSP